MSSAALERQLAYVPQVIGRTVAPPVLVCGGMGGSSLPARLLRYLGAYPYLIAHQDYGLPLRMPPDAHYVAVSYSGETEETLSFAEEAIAAGVPLSIVASGGRLLALAERHGLPHVRVPAGEVPRDAVVPMTRALLALIGEDHCFAPSEAAGSASYDADGEALAGTLGGSVPLFYASTPNEPLAGLAKTLFNETAKVPSFANVFPELDHNELQGFDGHAPELLERLVAVFIEDPADDARIKRRSALTRSLLEGRGVRTAGIALPEGSRADAFIALWQTARIAARSLAATAGVNSDATPLIEDFKRRL